MGLRFGNNANNGNLSPRYWNGNNAASNTNTNYAGSAKIENKNKMFMCLPRSGENIRQDSSIRDYRTD